MKILLIADHEDKALWDYWSAKTAERLSDVRLILSAGDLDADYLEFLVTMLNVPLVYIHGNHDGAYLKEPPKGCIDADGRVVDVKCGPSETVRILGLGGSMRYNAYAPHMYSEKEMKKRIAGLKKTILKDAVRGRLRGRRGIDILLTHAPCRGYGDLDDLPHQGFECFNDLLSRQKPGLHVYGHVHRAYTGGSHDSSGGRTMTHPSGTVLINADTSYVIDCLPNPVRIV